MQMSMVMIFTIVYLMYLKVTMDVSADGTLWTTDWHLAMKSEWMQTAKPGQIEAFRARIRNNGVHTFACRIEIDQIRTGLKHNHISNRLHLLTAYTFVIILILTRMVQLPATAAIEYVAAGHFFPGGLLPGGTFGRGDFCPGGLCPFPPSSMRIRTV